MKLEDQVCSFEQAIKLNKLGVNLKSLYRYGMRGNVFSVESIDPEFRKNIELVTDPAYTVGEFSLLLPFSIPENYLWIEKTKSGKWLVGYGNNDSGDILFCHDKTEFSNLSDAMADRLIWLLKNDFLKAEELKL